MSGTAEILEHSMESLLVSDSSEECISPGEIPAGEDEADGGLVEEVVGDGVCYAAEVQLQQQTVAEAKEERSGEDKKKKRRISSRRERKISLSGKVDRMKVSVEITCNSTLSYLSSCGPRA